MKNDLTEVTLRIPIPIDKPNANGTIITKEAIENAIKNAPSHLPIIYENGDKNESKVIGSTNGLSIATSFEYGERVCTMIANGFLYNCDVDIVVNKIKDGEISSFEITGVSLIK